MLTPSIFSLIALLCLLPAALQPWLPTARAGWVFWLSLGLALVGPIDWTLWQMAGQWPTGLSADLWVMISASLILFAAISLLVAKARSLAVLLMPYLILLASLASLSATDEAVGVRGTVRSLWLDTHILVSVAVLGLLTLAAAAALACFVQTRALKTKRPDRLSRLLPSVSDSERLYEMLLILSEAVLAAGVASGIAIQLAETGQWVKFDNKSLFSLLAFVLIAVLIAGRRWGGVRGRSAVRGALVAYGFVLFGYFGVKFVRQLLL